MENSQFECFSLSILIPNGLLQGPNWIWSVDGHEKLAQPYGLYIYGIVDTFSRKCLSLNVLPDKCMDTVCGWTVKALQSANGMVLA